jgi:hypothetical protein
MKTALWIGIGIVVVVALVVVGLGAGWALWGRQLWTAGPAYARDGDVLGPGCARADAPGRGPRPRFPWRPRSRSEGPEQSLPCLDADPGEDTSTDLTIEDAQEAAEGYLESRGLDELEVSEVMEFEDNYYVIAIEQDTGVGAMELLVDRESSAVGPEMGPNMMWNERYGMHRRGMMSIRRRENAIGPDEAVDVAQRWLDTNRPGITADDHAVPFYGYYTIHTLEDGDIEGMLSVHGATGQVWYHTWHGEFVQMVEEEHGH